VNNNPDDISTGCTRGAMRELFMRFGRTLRR